MRAARISSNAIGQSPGHEMPHGPLKGGDSIAQGIALSTCPKNTTQPCGGETRFGKMARSPPQPKNKKKGHHMDIPAEFISASINAFEANKRLADRAVEQVPDDKLHVALDGNTNSIAVIMKHIAGNLLSRWTDFLTTDGEKPWRNRDDEFVDSFSGRAALLTYWERRWAC